MAFAIQPAAADAPPAHVTIRGHITKPDGSPAARAQVSAQQKHYLMRPDDPFTTVADTVSDQNGAYEFQLTLRAYTNIHIEHPKFAAMYMPLFDDLDSFGGQLPLQAQHTLVRNIQLVPSAKLEGRVLDDGGRAVPEVNINALESPPYSEIHPSPVTTTSTRDGRFHFPKAPVGKLKLSLRAPGYVPRTFEVTSASKNVDIRMSSQGGSIGGRVIDSLTSAPVANAGVNLRQWSDGNAEVFYWLPIYATTAADGTYRFDHLPPGRFLLDAESAGRHAVPMEDEEARLVAIEMNEAHLNYDIPIYPGHTVTGTVVDVSSSTPLPGALVTFGIQFQGDTVTTAITDGDGHYRLYPVFAPRRKGIAAQVSRAGYRMATERESSEYQSVDLDPQTLSTNKELAMVPTTTIHGQVLWPDGMGAAAAQVTIIGDRQYWPNRVPSTTTDRAGNFQLEANDGQPFNLVYSAAGYPTEARKFVSADASTTITLQLDSGREIHGVTLDQDGHPLPDALITVRHNYTPVAMTYSSADGTFSFSKITADTVTLQVRKSPLQFDGPTLTREALPENLILRAPTLYAISGHVTDEQGKPAADVKLSARGTGVGDSSGEARTDENGNYKIEGLLKVRHYITVPTWQPWRGEQQLAFAPSPHVDFRVQRIAPIQMLCHVVDARTGKPLANFQAKILNDKKHPLKVTAFGEFTVDNLFPGEGVTVNVTSPGRVPLQRQINVPDNGTPNEETFELGAPGAIEGVVCYHDAAHSPAPRTAINIISESINSEFDDRRHAPGNYVYTDANGRFRKDGLPPGAYNIELVRDLPGSRNSTNATVVPGMVVQAPALLLERAQHLTGQVLRLVAVPDVRVVLNSSPENLEPKSTTEALTRSDGTFDIPDVSQGQYRVSYESNSANVDVSAEPTSDVDFLYAAQSLDATVLRGGQPVPGVHVQLARTPIEFRNNAEMLAPVDTSRIYTGPAVTGENGVCHFGGLVPGRWHATFTKYDLATTGAVDGAVCACNTDPARAVATPTLLTPLRDRNPAPVPCVDWLLERDISVGPSDLTTCTINVPAGELRGYVVDENNRPLFNANFSIRIAPGQPLSETRDAFTTTDETGHFRISALAEGRYTIQTVSSDGQQLGNAQATASAKPTETKIRSQTTKANIPPVARAMFP